MFVVVPIQSTEAAAVILPNQDRSLLSCVCVWWCELSPGAPSLSSKLNPAARPSRPVRSTSTFCCPRSPSAYLVAVLATEPSPSKSIQVTRCRIIPQPLRHAALVRLILLSGFTLPGAAKIAFATNHQTFNEPLKLSFRLLVGYFSSRFLLLQRWTQLW